MIISKYKKWAIALEENEKLNKEIERLEGVVLEMRNCENCLHMDFCLYQIATDEEKCETSKLEHWQPQKENK